MLIDLWQGVEAGPLGAALAIISGGSPRAHKIADGLYRISHFSFGHMLGATYEPRPGAWHSYPDLGQVTQWGSLAVPEWGSYGVCDSVEQFTRHPLGQWLAASDRQFVVSFTAVRKAEQEPYGGWRWHKWGEYIGERTPTCEYLYDEPEIEAVEVFHVYEMVAPK